MDKPYISHLLDLYFNDQISSEEREVLFTEWENSSDNEEWQELMRPFLEKTVADNKYAPGNYQLIIEHILKQKARVVPLERRWTYKIIVAACIILLAGIGSYLLFFRTSPRNEIVAKLPTDVKAPQNSKAIITLADGRKIFLDSAANGTLTQQANVLLVKNADGQVQYKGNGNEHAQTQYNTLFNPRGSKVINLTLSDGTKVWLNSETSLKYPIAFSNTERKVEVNGEAYFEVAHDAAKPFIVSKGETEVEVLGTHFNVNAYDDESAIKVTLLQGSVKVKHQSLNIKLVPGEQAEVKDGLALTINRSPNLDEVMAWKEGVFKYYSIDLASLMREAARWYDVDVHFAAAIPKDTYSGAISRSVSLATWFKILEESGVHFKIEGRNVTVTP